jgi:hypothetical protein
MSQAGAVALEAVGQGATPAIPLPSVTHQRQRRLRVPHIRCRHDPCSSGIAYEVLWRAPINEEIEMSIASDLLYQHIHTLVEQQAQTRLSYGELLIAHLLATKSEKSFAQIVAMRAKTQTWGEVAKQLEVEPDFLVTRADAASTRIRFVEYATRRRPQRESGVNYTSINPHTQTAHIR